MARTFLLVGWFAAAALLALASVLFARANDPGAANLLSNGGFEKGTSDWVWLGGTLAVNGQHYEGNSSGAIELSSAPAVIRQEVSLEPGGSYFLSGRFLFTNPSVTLVRLELDWENDQSVLEHQGFDLTTSDGNTWLAALVQLDPLPCDAVWSEVRVQIVGQPGAVVLLDDLRLKGSPPATPCQPPTATPTASAVPSATVPAVSTATRTPSPTGAPTATRTPSPTGPPTSTRTTTSTRTATPVPQGTATAAPSSTPSATIAPVTPTPSNGLIVNGGFESIEGGELVGWRTFGGTLLQAAEPVRDGLYAGCFVSETASTKWLYQTVSVTPGAWYEMNGYVYDNDPGVAGALLRISWYESADASGSAISTADSTVELVAPEDAYRPLTTGPVQAPANAHSANARALLRPQSAATARICVDDVSFASTNPPEPAPAASPTATATATSTPTPTWLMTPTPTVIATSSSLPTPTASATRTPTPAATATRTLAPTAPATMTPTLPASSTALPPATATLTRAPSPTRAVEPAADPSPPGERLVNGGFESASVEGLIGWSKHGGVLGQISEPVHSGNFAVQLYSASDGTKWLYQTVAVEPNGWYELQAYVRFDDASVAGALLRVSWHESNDGSGGAIAQADSTEELSAPDATYRQLTTGPLRAPPNALSTDARILLRPRDSTGAVLYVDDVSFDAVAPPDQPAETPANDPPVAGTVAGGPEASASPSSAVNTSAVLGVVERRAPAPVVPQPTPVIRRAALAVSTADVLPSDPGVPWWPWALAAGATVAAVTGAVAYVWGRVRRAAEST